MADVSGFEVATKVPPNGRLERGVVVPEDCSEKDSWNGFATPMLRWARGNGAGAKSVVSAFSKEFSKA